MAGDTEELVLSISADVRQMQRALARLTGETDRAVKTVQSQFDSMGRSIDTDLQKRINQMVGAVRDGGKEWKGALAGQGAELDNLRAKFNPVFSVIQRYKATIAEIRSAHRLGGLSADEMASAISRERQAALSSIAAIKGRNAAIAASPAPVRALGAAMKVSSLQTGNLAAQINDIGVQLAGGQNPFLIAIQQGSQINQVLGQAGARGAVSALAGAFTSLINPVSLATIAIIGLGGLAVQYISSFLTDSGDMEKALKEQADLIDRVAQKWGEALPSLKAYNDERKRLQDEGDISTAVEAVAQGEYEQIREVIKTVRAEVAALVIDLQHAGAEDTEILQLQQVFNTLVSEIEDGNAKVDRLRQVQSALDTLFRNTSIPAAKDMAESIGEIADELQRAVEASSRLRAENAIRDFFKRSPLGTLGGLGPITSGGGKLLNPAELQDFRASGTKSEFQQEQERLARTTREVADSFEDLNNGVVGRYVDQVVKAESGGNRFAKNPLSSATGLGQFIESTWLAMFRKEFPDRAKSMSDSTILALRTDADISRKLIEAYAQENAALLRSAGVAVNEAALHLAHFLGPQGAVAVLTAKAGTPVSQVLSPGAIQANPTILGSGATVEDVIAYGNKRAGDTAALAANFQTAAQAAREFDKAEQQALKSAEQLGSTIGSGLANAFADGKVEARELLGIVMQIASQLLRMPGGIAGGGGFLGGLLSSIIPGFANGTNSAPGGLAWVGERGKELVNLPQGSQVIPNHRLDDVINPRAGAARNSSIVVNAPINAPGADAAALARVERSVHELGKSIPKMVDARTDARQTRKVRA